MIIIQLISQRNLNRARYPVIPDNFTCVRRERPSKIKLGPGILEARRIDAKRIRNERTGAVRYSRVRRISTISFLQTLQEYSQDSCAATRRRVLY